MPVRSTTWIVALLFVCAFWLRLDYVQSTVVVDPFRSDAREYVIYASNLLTHGTFSRDLTVPPEPDSFRAPGYPALVAMALWIAGDDRPGDENAFYPFLLRIQAVLGALLVPLTYLLGCRFLPKWGALVATTAVALSPHLVSLTGYVLTETLFSLLSLAAIYGFVIALERGKLGLFALSGTLFGTAYLTNQTFLLIPPLFAAAALTLGAPSPTDIETRAKRLGLIGFLVCFFAFPLSWSLRNSTGVPETARTSSDRAFATMTHGIYPGWVHEDPRLRYYAYRDDPQTKELRSSPAAFLQILGERIRQRPGRYLSWFLLEKPYWGWSWSILQGQGDIYVYAVKTSLYHQSKPAEATRLVLKMLHPLVLLLSCAGLPICFAGVRHRRSRSLLVRTPLLLAILILYYTAIFIVFAPWPRYSIPLRPELYLFAMWAALAIARAWGPIFRRPEASA
ncbi:glycosyltransferase family 39 protein [Myxococcota bacterium]|nr:glycosyltransferase family 39 protein [Myxococcota bacterium]